jgi:hypothetical protein
MFKQALKNKESFLEFKTFNNTTFYFNFFQKRFWDDPIHIEYVNVNKSFSEGDLCPFPKEIRQILDFKFEKHQCKYVLFKDYSLTILKKNKNNKKFKFTSLKNDFKKFNPFLTDLDRYLSDFDLNYRFIEHFNQNIRWMELSKFGLDSRFNVYVILYKKNLKQVLSHQANEEKIELRTPQIDSRRLFLKENTGFFREYFNLVDLYLVVKKENGKYTTVQYQNFRTSVKKILSEDFKHYFNEVQFLKF